MIAAGTSGARSRPSIDTRTRDAPPKIWGLDARGLHDRFWAGCGVQVVRRGVGTLGRTRARSYLLLDPDELVMFTLPRAAERLPKRQTNAVGIRVFETEAEAYTERIIADGSKRLVAFRRRYASPIRSVRHVMLTSSPLIASTWYGSLSTRGGLRDVRLAAGLNGYREASCRGRVFDASDRASADRCILALMQQWQDIEASCRDVSTGQPGVWVHDTALVESGVRFIGPVWVGAGVSIEAGQVVVGPRIFMDEATIEPARSPVARHSRRASSRAKPPPSAVTRPRRVARRLFDIAFSVATLALAAPLVPLIMLAIWWEDGRPVFFAQTRQTRGGRNFVCFKFRTMCRNAEQLKAQLVRRNVCDGPQFHAEDDPRLLRVGRFLRRFHLDELPQFVNVLLGQMSVIGPRPSPDDENQFCPAWRDARLSVRPGLTGLWQVNRTRAPNSDFQEWIRHDLDYVESQSLRLDLLIIFKTTGNIMGSLRGRTGRSVDPRGRHRRGAASAGGCRRLAALR